MNSKDQAKDVEEFAKHSRMNGVSQFTEWQSGLSHDLGHQHPLRAPVRDPDASHLTSSLLMPKMAQGPGTLPLISDTDKALGSWLSHCGHLGKEPAN